MKIKEMTVLVSNAFEFKTKNLLFGISSKSRGKHAKDALKHTFTCAHTYTGDQVVEPLWRLSLIGGISPLLLSFSPKRQKSCGGRTGVIFLEYGYLKWGFK